MRKATMKAFAAAAALGVVLSGCGSTKDAAGGDGGGGEGGKVGATVAMLTSPFWQAYNNYVPQMEIGRAHV